MTTQTIAVIGGDGIGPEVVAEGLKVLRAVAPDAFEFEMYDLGAERWQRTGEVLTDDDLAQSGDRRRDPARCCRGCSWLDDGAVRATRARVCC